MKINSIVRTLLVGTVLSAGSLFANTLKIRNTGNDGGLVGGEFKVEGQAGLSLGTDFYTFCLERHVGIDLPSAPGWATYDYTVDLLALTQGDVLSVGSAWLYEQFFLGTLAGPTGSGNYTDNRDANAGLLQAAFWKLEQESGSDSNLAVVPGPDNDYIDMVISEFGSLALARADIGLNSSVVVLNLWIGEGLGRIDRQSVLVYVPTPDTHTVPDSGMTAALLGLGLLSLVAFRRKL